MDDLHLSEEVVFDEMVNEVSIVDDEQNRNQQNLIQIQSTSITESNTNQFSSHSVKSPNKNSQVTSIRNVTPNKCNQTKSGSKVVNSIVLTPKSQLKTRSQTATPPSTSKSITVPTTKQNASPTISITTNNQQIFHKVIMTTGGQQLFITSPVKQGPVTRTSESSTNNQEKQLIGLVPISPAKQTNKSTTPNQSNLSIRSKPANITIQSPTNQADKQTQYQIIRLVSATGNTSNTTNSIVTTGLKQIASSQTGQQQKVLIPASALKNLSASQFINNSVNSSGGTQQFLMYTPAQLIQQSPATTSTTKQVTFSTNTSSTASTSNTRQSFVPILPNPSTIMNNSVASTSSKGASSTQKLMQNGSKNVTTNTSSDDQQAITASIGIGSNRPRKPCNCTRSQCLKLYCDCFANGEFCSNCNCINCFNNLDHEENRQKAIKQCLERNPHAFHPKIGKGKTTAQEGIERRHTKGCNCRRSGCLKNYCECYEAKILCTDLCKCCACKNYEDSYERKSLMHLVDAVDIRSSLHSNASGVNFVGKENDPLWSNEFRPKLPVPFVSNRLVSCSFITNDLVDATTQCLIAQAEKSQKLGLSEEETERAIIEEFGGCLTQIIEVANKEKQK